MTLMYSCSTKYTVHMWVFVSISLLNCLCWFGYLSIFTFLGGVRLFSMWTCRTTCMKRRHDHHLVATGKKVKSPCEHVFHPGPHIHRWNPNQLKLFECSNISVKRSECDSSSLHQHSTSSPQSPVSLRTVKDDHSDKQKNVITLQSHHAVYCQGGASPASRIRRHYGHGVVQSSSQRFQCLHIAETQIGCMGPQECLIRLIFIE